MGFASAVAASAPALWSKEEFRLGMGKGAASGVVGAEIELVSCLEDNYAPLIHDPSTGMTAVVDTPEVEPILAALERRGWKLTHVLNTHHHWDHTGGNEALQKLTGCEIIGPAGEADKIPGLGRAVREGDKVLVGSLEAEVFEVGGHTKGHIAFHFPANNVAFVGDTLFVLGCGRLFEGTPTQMWASMQKIRNFPDETVVYCGHEYTRSNARFAEHIGGTPGLSERVAAIRELRDEGEETVPMVLGHEKATNPFLRADDEGLRIALGLPQGALPVQVFADVRKKKDKF